MRFLEDSEDSILSLIRFPDRKRSLLYGDSFNHVDSHLEKRESKLTLGISTVKRENNASYVEKTIDFVLDRTSEEEKKDLTVVVSVVDQDENLRFERAKALYHRWVQNTTTVSGIMIGY